MNYIYRFDIAAIIISIAVFVSFYRERTVKTKFVSAFTIIFFLYDISSGNIVIGKNKKPIVTGIPVYDLPQL